MENEFVTRRGKLFHVGAFPHRNPQQQFEFSESDLDKVVSEFTPVSLELQHFQTTGQPSIFDGKLGDVPKVWKQGSELFAEYRVPTWVDKVWGEAGRKVSAVFDPMTKQLTRVGLVLNPRVPDAVAMSDDEAEAADAVVEWSLATAYAEFAGRQHTPQSDPPRDLSVGQTTSTNQEAIIVDKTEKKDETVTPPAPPPAMSPQFAAEHESMKAELERMRAENATLQAQGRMDRAKAQVEGLIQAGKLFPATFALNVASLAQAMSDDAATPVTFSATEDGAKLTRAAALVAAWNAAPSHGLNVEQMRGNAVGLLRFSDESDETTNPLTPAGAEANAKTWAERMNGRKPTNAR